MSTTVLLTLDPRGVATVMLNRPDKHNAFNAELIAQLDETLTQLEQTPSVRVVVLTGAGVSFCAGADIHHMQCMVSSSETDNFNDALAIARCMRKLDELNKPVIARINGNVFAGGMGLICCADIAIAAAQAKFCLSEVRLGLTTAVIAPYVLPVLGQRQARRLILTAERIDADRAWQLGLIHRVVAAESLDRAINDEIELLLQGAPLAQAMSKKIIRETLQASAEQELGDARRAKLLAQLRLAPEAREGLQSFIEKRKPDWAC